MPLPRATCPCPLIVSSGKIEICPPLPLSGPHLCVREPFRFWVALVVIVARLTTYGFYTTAVA